MKKFLFTIATIATIALVGCEMGDKDSDKDSGDKKKPGNMSQTLSSDGLYLAITGFNNDLIKYADGKFQTVDNYAPFYDFIDELTEANGTILYYAVEDAIAQLNTTKFPNNLQMVSIVTFTDGLDQGSTAKNPSYNSPVDYLDAIKAKLKNTKIDAFTIGLKGNDVHDEELFLANINKLSNPQENGTPISDISEVENAFSDTAKSLINEIQIQTLTLTIPKPYNNTKIRFTFDIGSNDDADDSRYYIEGTYKDGALTTVVYKGLTCDDSGSDITEILAGGINVSFVFNNIKGNDNFKIVEENTRQWSLIQNTGKWQVNSEFDPHDSNYTALKRNSAAIILLLDSSTSLGSDFSQIKRYAKDFIKILYESYYGEASQK